MLTIATAHAQWNESRPTSPFERDTILLPPHIVQPELQVLLVGVAISIVSNFADYQLQAEQHNWDGLMWERYHRAPKWGMWDFVPHDGYHIAQTVRNTLMLAMPVVVMLMTQEWQWWQRALAVLGSYIVGRGIGFSLPQKAWN